MNGTPLLSLKHLCAWYKPDKHVLSQFSLDLTTNEVVGLIGLNGSGKTTLIKTLSGLHDGHSVESATFQGNKINFRARAFKLQRYTVFAEDISFQYFTLDEYLAYVFKAYHKTLPNVTELIKGFQFEDYRNVLIRELSTGNRKKAYLITAFALCPALLLLDEPVNGLDFQSTEFLYKLINNFRTFGTIMFSSHVLESICLTADRVLVLENGRISHSFSKSEINAEQIREALHHDHDI